MKPLRLVFALLLVVMLFARQHAPPVYAAGYVVNSLLDNTTNDTFCTLREAILAANNAPANANCDAGSAGNDTITFSVIGTITLSLFLPNIVSGAGTLTIDGGGSITISGNNAVRVMTVDSGASLTLRNLTIANASTLVSGGGVANSGTLTVINSTFSGNSASTSGGGIVNLSSGVLAVSHSTFSGNSATNGGGIDNAGGTVTVTNSTFSGNSATNGGGISSSGTLTVHNSTFSGNSASTSGGGIRINGGSATLRNTIIANSTSGGDCVGTLSGTNNNNLIESAASACGLTNGVNGNIIGQDPNLGALTGSPASFPLNAGSPAIDAGDNATCAATPVNNQSQNGVTRPQDGDGNSTAVCDIGAYERTLQPASYVVNTLNDNTILGDSLCTLREAILAANNAPVYNSNSGCGPASSLNDTITFSVSGTITLIATLPAIVSGQGTLTIDGSGQNITISGGNTVRVMLVNSGANLTLQRVTIADGNASGGDGGGIANSGTLTVSNSVFSNNRAANRGGGIGNLGGALTITSSTFSGNNAINGGGGIANAGGALTVSNSTFSSNSANEGGGIIAGFGAVVTVSNSTFSGNSAVAGGGIANAGTLTVSNSTFSGNSVTEGGGGIANFGTLAVSNSTFSSNSANLDGGGIYVSFGSTLTVSNSTFSSNSATNRGGGIWNNGALTVNNSTFSANSASASGGGVFINGGSATLRNTIIANSASGGDCVGALSGTNNNNLIESAASACGLTNGANGNIVGQDPNLGAVTGSPAYFPLTAGSPAINAGDNATCAATDQRGVSRPQGGRCDIGAFEVGVVSLPLVVR